MSVAEKLVERRNHKRFSVSKGAFVALRPHYQKIGQVLSISMGGLAFAYLPYEEGPKRSFELDIFLAGGSFYLRDVPFGTISDLHNHGMPLSSEKMRRMGVQFSDLTPHQVSQLEYFIQNHTEGEE